MFASYLFHTAYISARCLFNSRKVCCGIHSVYQSPLKAALLKPIAWLKTLKPDLLLMFIANKLALTDTMVPLLYITAVCEASLPSVYYSFSKSALLLLGHQCTLPSSSTRFNITLSSAAGKYSAMRRYMTLLVHGKVSRSFSSFLVVI